MSNLEKFENNKDSSAIFNLSKHLVNIGIEISPEEIQILILHQYKQQQYWQKELYKFSFIPGVYNWRVVAAVAFAVVGILLAPVLGVSAVVGALVGASIGWKVASALVPEKKNVLQKFEPKQPEKVSSIPGFDSSADPPVIGGVVPLIYGKNGGVQVKGNVLYSRYFTLNNTQQVVLIISLGLGEIKNINPSKLLVNGQPVANFTTPGISSYYTSGFNNQDVYNINVNNQTLLSEFRINSYSQAVTPLTNNNFGYTFLGKYTVLSAFVFQVPDLANFDNFNFSNRYRVYKNTNTLDYLEFVVASKNISNLTITIQITRSSAGLTLNNFPTNNNIFVVYYEAVFNTFKKCTAIELQLNLELFGIDSNGNYINHGMYFLINIDDQIYQWFYEVNKKPGILKRGILIENLAYKYHKIVVSPAPWAFEPKQNIHRLDGFGSYRNIPPLYNTSGNAVNISFENSLQELTITEINNSTLPKEFGISVSQLSSDRGAIGRLTGVNEIVSYSTIGQNQLSRFFLQSLCLIRIIASEKLSGSVPSLVHYIEEGRQGQCIVLYGVASPGTIGTKLVCNSPVALPNYTTYSNLFCKNITKQIATSVVSFQNNTINLANDFNFTVGDEFYIFYIDALSYFPDIYLDTLLSPYGGLGKIITDKFIDFPSIIKSKTFCIQNNFYFDDIIDNSVSWNEWASFEATASLLLPTKYGGLYGLTPETNTEPVAIFTSSNIIKGTFQEASSIKQKINAIQLTYRAKEDDGSNTVQFYKKTITVMTTNAYNNNESYYPESITFDSIVNENQAIRVAQVALKSRIIQDKIVEFYTGIQGFYLREADLIFVQYGLTELEGELSGFCLSANSLSAGTQIIKLSTPLGNLTSIGKTATIYHLQTGIIQKNKPFSIGNNQLVITNLTESIRPPSNGFSGDVVIINSNLNTKIFRVSAIDPEPYRVKVTAIYWSSDILNTDGIVTVGNK